MILFEIEDIFLSTLYLVPRVIYFLYEVLLFVGYLLFLSISRLILLCITALKCFHEGIVVSFEDFNLFIDDFRSIVVFLLSCIFDCINQTVHSLKRLTTALKCIVWDSPKVVPAYRDRDLSAFLLDSWKLFGDALALIGSYSLSFLIFLISLPQLTILSGVVVCNHLIEGFYLLINAIAYETIFGFITVATFAYYCHKFNLLIQLWINFTKITLRSTTFVLKYCRQLWIFVSACIIRLNKTTSKKKKTSTQASFEEEKYETLCIVCLDNRRNAILLNCRHLVMCVNCSYTLLRDSQQCPVCRKEIYDIMQIYT